MSSGPLLSAQHNNPIFGFKVEIWPHSIVLHAKYGIRFMKPRQYTTMSSICMKAGPTSQTPKTMRR